MFDMFEEIGIFGDVIMPEIEEQKTSKKAKTKNTEKKEQNKKKEESKYKLPVKVLFDSVEPVEIEGDRELTKAELFAEIAKMTDYQAIKEPEKYFKLEKLGERTYLYRPLYSAKCEKGSSGKYLLLGHILVLDEIIVQEDDKDISVDDVKKYIEDSYGYQVELYLVEEIYIPVPVNMNNDSLEKLEFPVKASALSLAGESLEITKEDYLAFIPKKEEQLSLIEESEVETDFTVTEDVIVKVLTTFFPDYEKDLAYRYDSEKNLICVNHKNNAAQNTSAATVKKEELYPTDATVSLIFTRLQLSSELFGGKKEITKKEVLKYIGKQYPEYSPERTELVYDSKKKLIIPSLKSGKRGSYCLKEEEDFRYERTPIMEILAFKEERKLNGCVRGRVSYSLPKIPYSILKDVVDFFLNVFEEKDTEAVALIFYDKKIENYEVRIPKQTAGAAFVEFERDISLELDETKYLVMEIHSHGRYGTFWSDTDNREELSHRLYAVVGSLKDFAYDDLHIIVRAATGGLQVKIPLESIFCL